MACSPKLCRPANSGTNNLTTILFHSIHGENVRLSADSTVAQRNGDYCQAYVFAERPLRLGQKLVIQVLQTDDRYKGSLAFGLTTCDPSTINSNDLPEDSHQLLDRSEYWVVIKDVANGPQAGDEMAFKMTESGEVHMTHNREPVQTLMHVDSTQRMWPFFDLYGNTNKVKVLEPLNATENKCIICCEQPINSVLYMCGHVCMCHECAVKQWLGSGECPICRATILEVIPLKAMGNECNVCYKQPINSILFRCRHACMCYSCAAKQWRGPGWGQCPKCRAGIQDVIRIFLNEE
ncbi:unnamed protein product [Medioppia subpectinata]|uniref:Neuralized n=1 Tax=Medioppia subpectinata TaxID=1979941 RepID=A0A7R9KFZ9_9ACAR|nr:unnamed protein product [Medioppia subpectinata]CAG2102849.1 unnamed protein product [Medioppia subpectinata]